MHDSYRLNHYDVLAHLLHTRHSCRAFASRAVPRGVCEQILTLAQRTASWCNTQPWQLYIASDERLERMRLALQERAAQDAPSSSDMGWPREYRGAYLQRRRACGWSLYQALGIAQNDREGSARQATENFRMFGAPHVAIVTSDEALGTYGAIDCGAYIANFVLAAQSLGVATVVQASIAAHSKLLHEELEIPSERSIVCGISFGYEDHAHPANSFRTDRAGIESAVVWR